MKTQRSGSLLLLSSVLALLCACGDTSDGGGGGGGSGAGPTVGELCTGSCETGLICDGNLFDGQCTVQCANDAACEQHSPSARCFGSGVAECGQRCDTDADCSSGTKCVAVPGGTSPMACVRK